MTLSIGTKLGRYEIRKKIGEGGMGEVYQATDNDLNRTVALKILPAHIASQQNRLQRFVLEAKAASALNHPHILTIYEIGAVGDLRFIATEFVEGETLQQRIKSGLNLAQILEIERVDDCEEPAVRDMHEVAVDARAVAVRRPDRPQNERDVDTGQAERLAGDRERRQDDGGHETPESDARQIHASLVNAQNVQSLGPCKRNRKWSSSPAPRPASAAPRRGSSASAVRGSA